MWDRASLEKPGRADARSRKRVARALAALSLLPALGGCVAAAIAVPAAVAAGMIGKNVRVRAATPVPERDGQVEEGLAATSQRTAGGATLTALGALPTPSIAGTARDPWLPFVTYALGRAANPQLGESVILGPDALTAVTPPRMACPKRTPAVVVDLDDGVAAFAPGSAGPPSPGLAEGLARLRAAGVVVLWVSQAQANDVRKVADALQLSGLDPTGRDPLLLVRKESDRKQTLRWEANFDVCVIAIAGDRRGDFDELFDYLRDPATAVGLEGLIGAGWFIAPAPLGAAE